MRRVLRRGTRCRRTRTNVHSLDDADHHQQVPQEVQERQQPRVPQQPDDRQAVAGDVDAGDQREAADAQPRAVEVAAHD